MQLLTVFEITRLLKIDRHAIYRMVKCKNFPAPIIVSTRKYRWLKSDIEEWILLKKEHHQ